MSKKRPPNAEATEFRAGEQQVEIARQGGIASGKARKAKKSLREAMQVLMDADLTGKDGKTMTGTEAMAAKAFQAALKGDWKAWELVRDTAGQKPVDKVQATQTIVGVEALQAMSDAELVQLAEIGATGGGGDGSDG